MLEDSSDAKLGHAGVDLLERLRQRTRCDSAGVPDERDFVSVLRFAQGFDQVHLRPPLPAGAVGKESLKIAMEQVCRLEPDDVDATQSCREIP